MKIKNLLIILILGLSFFVAPKIVNAFTCQGQGDPRFCYTGTHSPQNVSVCSYSCGYDGYTCTPSCDGVTYFESCTNSPTVHCAQVQVGCPRCGNVHSCYTKTVISPTATPTPTPTPPPPTPPPACQPGSCDTSNRCKVYTSPSGSTCTLNGQVITSGTCMPDSTCAPGNTCEPNNGRCMQAGQCSGTPNSNFTCSGVGQICCPNPPAATATSVPPASTSTPAATATPRPPANTCEDGATCTQNSCIYPNGTGDINTCAACGGNWCDGGKCHCPPPAEHQPTPTPTYILVNDVNTPTPKPTGTGSQAKPAQSWMCLKSDPYDGPILPDGTNSDHRLTLNGAGFPNNQNIYIVGCALLNGSFQCTTGDTTIDNALGIQKAAEHEFAVAGGPVVQTVNNRITAVVRSASTTSTIHTFFGVYSLDPNAGQNNQSGNSLQLGTFTVNDTSVSYHCTGVRWDPYGRVFDNRSLEPIPNISLQLLNSNKQLVNLPGLTNPAFTNDSGSFNFLVEPGSYYLNLANLNKKYTIVGPNDINPNANKAYSDIYTPGEKIVEKAGQPVHRDIAVDPGKNSPMQYQPTSIEFTTLPLPGTNQTKLEGQVSHPLTIVAFMQDGKELGRTVADKFGYYELIVNNSEITPGVNIIPAFKKVTLTTQTAPQNQTLVEKITSFITGMFKRTSAAPEPAEGAATQVIPYYLEGSVYGSLSQTMKNAQVELVLTMSNKSVYQTTSDENGYITINHEYIPLFPFYLQITPQGSTTTMKKEVSQFIDQNKAYFSQHQIDIMKAK